jgi:phosphatidylcholine synthase
MAADLTERSIASPARRAAAWAVHLYTASGALAALAALLETTRGAVPAAFGWLYLAVVIDATDGTLARAARVKEYVPEFDGAKLDDIVDYLTFVLVPIFVMLQCGLLVGWSGGVAAVAATLASAYRFCHAAAKTPDHFFTGFPSYWNVVALYLYVFDAPPPLCAAITTVLALFVIVPLRFIYPSRTPNLRPLSLTLGIVWAALLAVVLLELPDRSTGLAAVSLFYPAYYTVVSFILDWRSRRGPGFVG